MLIPELPLSEAQPEEILARTAYRLIMADYRTDPHCYDNPVTRLLDLAIDWRSSGLDVIADAFTDAAIFVGAGNTIAAWKSHRSGNALRRELALSRVGRARRR